MSIMGARVGGPARLALLVKHRESAYCAAFDGYVRGETSLGYLSYRWEKLRAARRPRRRR
jgi:hypothetical protein